MRSGDKLPFFVALSRVVAVQVAIYSLRVLAGCRAWFAVRRRTKGTSERASDHPTKANHHKKSVDEEDFVLLQMM